MSTTTLTIWFPSGRNAQFIGIESNIADGIVNGIHAAYMENMPYKIMLPDGNDMLIIMPKTCGECVIELSQLQKEKTLPITP